MSHYFINDASLENEPHILDLKIKDLSLRLHTDRGVFSKTALDFGTKVLLETLDIPMTATHVIDMGCGYGPISIYLGKAYPKIIVNAYDINERAVMLTQKNIEENALNNVFVQTSDLFENVDSLADVIITNPPIRAGKQTVFKLYDQAYEKLNQHGLFYVVIQKKQGAPSSVAKLETLFGQCEIIERRAGYWILLAKKS